MSERQYSESELKEILRDAAERSTSDGEQYTLSEIQRIAEQAGIAPEHVTRAAGALTVPVHSPAAVSRGASSGGQLMRRVNNPVSAADMMAALSIARVRLGETGSTRDLAGGAEWSYDSGFSSAVVSVLPDGDGAIVRLDSRADGRGFVLAAGALGVAVLAGFVVANTAATPTFSALTAALALLPSAAVARAWWNRTMRESNRQLRQIADDIALQLTRK